LLALAKSVAKVDSSEAATKYSDLESGLVQAGYDSSRDLPIALAAALITLRSKSGDVSPPSTDSFKWPKMSSIASFLRTNLPGTVTESELNQLRNKEKLDRVDIPRLSNYMKHHVNHGNGETLAAVWREYKSRLLDPLESEKHRFEIMAKILAACVRCDRRFRKAGLQETINEIMSNIPTPMPTSVFNVILANRANSEDGDELSIGIEGIDDNMRYSVERAEIGSLWREANLKGTVKDVRSYMIYIEGLGKAGHLDELQKIWNELVNDKKLQEEQADGIWPPINAFNYMLSSALLVRKTGPPFALEMFEQACRPGSTIPVNIITINTILRHHARMSDVPAMTTLFSLASQRQLKPDVITYTTLVQGLLRAGKDDMARAVLDRMTQQGLEPNERLCSMLIADLAKGGSQAGLRRAEEMMAQMRRKNMRITVQAWTSLISGYFRGGWEKDAWGAVDRMDRYGVKMNRVGYNIMLHEGDSSQDNSQGGSWPLKVFGRMLKAGVVPNDDTYLILLGPMVAKRRWEEADVVLKEMDRFKYKPTRGALSTLIRRARARSTS
jgi:pentatricopeptide repeat protein